jgi:YesN/AraC family two-component response regulator
MVSILVIDDEEHIRTLIRQMLELSGYKVYEAPDGKVGLEIFREKQVDLIITDILMPEKEGLETIMELRRSFPDVKIIAISGGGQSGNLSFLSAAKHLGALRTLTKPFSYEELLKTIRELI